MGTSTLGVFQNPTLAFFNVRITRMGNEKTFQTGDVFVLLHEFRVEKQQLWKVLTKFGVMEIFVSKEIFVSR